MTGPRQSKRHILKTMRYKAYHALTGYDDEDKIFVGPIAGIRSIAGFHGTIAVELESAFAEAVEDYLADCEEQGITPQRPYSGKIMLRVPPERHARVAMQAESHGMSLNQWQWSDLHAHEAGAAPAP